MNPIRLLPILGLSLLTACASNMSGLDGSDTHSCPYSEGVTCKPMSQVYEESTQGVASTPGVSGKAETSDAAQAESAPSVPRPRTGFAPVAEAGLVPLRTRPSVMRVWVAPWEDADGDLHEAAWIALRVDDGRWNIDHLRERIREGYGAALTPPPMAEAQAQAAKPAAAANTLARDVADVLPKGLVPASIKAEPAPFFDQP